MTKNLSSNLLLRARSWAGQLTSLAKGYVPDHLKPYIHSSVEEKKEGQYIIRIRVDRKANPQEREGSLDARAQEFGSGLHAKKGKKGKYPILPKNGQYLAFDWQVANESPLNFHFLPDGRVLLKKVNHPGIPATNAGKGYIAPAIREWKKRVPSDLNIDIRRSFSEDIRASFKGARKR